MRILLVYPELPDTFWSFKHALKFVRQRAGAPPLGLLTVAALLPPEWEKRLVDLNVTGLTSEDLAWADYVFISAMIVQRDSAREVIARCKQAGVKVVAGGPLFTMEHDRFPEVDHSGNPRRRARSLLAAVFLGSVPATPAVPTGHHAGHHGLSFPPGGPVARRLSTAGTVALTLVPQPAQWPAG